MKKLILASLAMVCFANANAQKNTVLLYGNVSGSTNSTTDSNGSKLSRGNINITPGIGYQFTEHWTAGIQLSYSYGSQKESYDNSVTISGQTNTYGGGVFARYTQAIGNVFFIYCHFVTGLNYTDQKSQGNSFQVGDITSNSIYATLTPAIGINIKNGYAVSLSCGNLGYTHSSTNADSKTNQMSFNFGGGAVIGVSKNISWHTNHASVKS